MVLVIGGHPRSGTTMLKNLCDQHPAMAVTFEFHSFLHLNQPLATYRRFLRKNWYARPLLGRWDRLPAYRKFMSGVFYFRYMMSFLGPGHNAVTLDQVESAYRRIFPRAALVGDKYPRYVFALDRLAAYPEMKRVMIYRDPRDVARSTLEKVVSDWRGRKFAARYDSAEKISRSWIRSMESIHLYQSEIFAVKYEELVREPEHVLAGLSDYLGVEYDGFKPQIVKSDRIGKFRHGLPKQQADTIVSIAGTWMTQYGYL
jgi:hypothetical protein